MQPNPKPPFDRATNELMLRDLTRHLENRLAQVIIDHMKTCKASGEITRDDCSTSTIATLMMAAAQIMNCVSEKFPLRYFGEMAEQCLTRVREDD